MEIDLNRNQEYRIEVLENQKLRIMVTNGLVEIRGQELLNEKWYTFSSIKTSLFTFTGARLKIDGMCDLRYISKTSSFPDIFLYFDQRYKAKFPKNILVLGYGRTTFIATIINYFIRLHKKARFTEIDPSRGNIFPGSISSMIIESLIDYQEDFKINNPISLFYGNTEIDNIELYDMQIDALISYISENHEDFSHFILAPNLNEDNLNNLIKKFQISEVVFVGDERSYNRLNLIVPKFFIENTGYNKENNISKSIHRYFNGSNNEYTPCSFILKQNFSIVRIGEEYLAPESALPLGSTRKVGKTSINKAEIIENVVLAISEANKESEIIISKIIGFVVCLDEKKSKILCTQPKLPKTNYLILGNIKYVDY